MHQSTFHQGRQIAAILRDSLCRKANNPPHDHDGHTKRHLWISVSRELIQDARRDLKDLGVHCDVYDGTVLLDDTKNGALGPKEKGVMFLTYPLLVSGKRLEQIINWCAGTHLLRSATSPASLAKKLKLEQSFSGCIILDEAHKAKNIANNTKTAKLVLELQRRLPKARVVYCSATGVSDVAHLAYAERLGLWDNTTTTTRASSALSTHHFADFSGFCHSLTSRGLASLEMLALELKQQGSFLARSLSWDGAEFESFLVDLNGEQRLVYDQSVQWWNTCRANMERALKIAGSEKTSSLLWRIFWSSHQRFFKELAICCKVESIAQDALKQVHENGNCVIIGLQSTGESGMQSLMENSCDKVNLLQDKTFPALLSTLQATLTTFVKNHFPVEAVLPELPKLPENAPSPTSPTVEREHYSWLRAEIARIKVLPPPEPIPELIELRQQLLDSIGSLNLPPNPLDDLIDRLGGVEHVAEMTGRSCRIVRASPGPQSAPKEHGFVFSRRITSSGSNSSRKSYRSTFRARYHHILFILPMLLLFFSKLRKTIRIASIWLKSAPFRTARRLSLSFPMPPVRVSVCMLLVDPVAATNAVCTIRSNCLGAPIVLSSSWAEATAVGKNQHRYINWLSLLWEESVVLQPRFLAG